MRWLHYGTNNLEWLQNVVLAVVYSVNSNINLKIAAKISMSLIPLNKYFKHCTWPWVDVFFQGNNMVTTQHYKVIIMIFFLFLRVLTQVVSL